jgi:hypothetical protein
MLKHRFREPKQKCGDFYLTFEKGLVYILKKLTKNASLVKWW